MIYFLLTSQIKSVINSDFCCQWISATIRIEHNIVIALQDKSGMSVQSIIIAINVRERLLTCFHYLPPDFATHIVHTFYFKKRWNAQRWRWLDTIVHIINNVVYQRAVRNAHRSRERCNKIGKHAHARLAAIRDVCV